MNHTPYESTTDLLESIAGQAAAKDAKLLLNGRRDWIVKALTLLPGALLETMRVEKMRLCKKDYSNNDIETLCITIDGTMFELWQPDPYEQRKPYLRHWRLGMINTVQDIARLSRRNAIEENRAKIIGAIINCAWAMAILTVIALAITSATSSAVKAPFSLTVFAILIGFGLLITGSLALTDVKEWYWAQRTNHKWKPADKTMTEAFSQAISDLTFEKMIQ